MQLIFNDEEYDLLLTAIQYCMQFGFTEFNPAMSTAYLHKGLSALEKKIKERHLKLITPGSIDLFKQITAEVSRKEKKK